MPADDAGTGGDQRAPSTSNRSGLPDIQTPRQTARALEQRDFRTAFRAHSRHASGSRSHSMQPRTDGLLANGSAEPNEQTHLLSGLVPHHGSDGGEPAWKDQNQGPLVRWPAYALHITLLTLTNNYVNVLLVFVPLGIISGALDWNPTATFVLNFFAIMPLASLLSYATEELSIPLGQTIGGLMNATFGNAVELIVSIVALKNNQIRIVQASMLGSILSNILLVLGCCFVAGGLRYHEQTFNSTVASTMSSLMAVATASLIIPATLYAALSKSTASAHGNILILSHGTAIILLIIYTIYLVFQLRTHTDLFDDEGQNGEEGEEGNGEGEGEGAAQLDPWSAGAVLVVVTIMVAVCAEYLVDSIDSIVQTAGISRTFIGLILIPIVGNAAEHVTAVVVAYKNKMDLAIGVAIGSSLQIALFVTPFLVILGWIMGVEMTLHFETFETVAFFVSSLVVTLLIQDGKSNYLEGVMSLGMYIIIALAFYVYPDDGGLSDFFKSFISSN